jgi:hypothetical protein
MDKAGKELGVIGYNNSSDEDDNISKNVKPSAERKN